MRSIITPIAVVPLLLACAGGLAGQQAQSAQPVPKLLRVATTFHPANGQPASPVESVSLSVYAQERGGDPLWSEMQNVNVDSEGRYTVLMGSTLPDGVAADLFAGGEPRWLGVRFNRPGEDEQARVLLVSVPYALKAADAETLGGRPASAYLLSPSANSAASDTAPAVGAAAASAPNTKKVSTQASAGTTNCIGRFTDATDLGCSVMWQSGSNIGIGTTTPGAALDVIGQAAVGTGGSTQTYGFDMYVNAANPRVLVDAYSSPGASTLILQGRNGGVGINQQLSVNSSGLFSVAPSSTGASALSVSQNGNVGLGILSPGAKLDVIGQAAIGSGGSSQTYGFDLYVNGANPIAFLDAYANPGSASLVLQGRGASAINHKLSVNSTGLFSIAPSTSGTAALAVTQAGNVGVGVTAPAAKLDVGGDINFSGNIRYTGANVMHFFDGTDVFLANTAVGLNALATNLGARSTAIGANALQVNTTGTWNTATGSLSMQSNTTGGSNTAEGYVSLTLNTSGSNNTAIGEGALEHNTTGSGNIAIGVQASTAVAGGNSNNIHIGSPGNAGDSATIRIGTNNQTSFFAAAIRGVTTGNNDAIPVMIDSNGQLGTVSSSRRFKEDIQDMGDASNGLMRLHPVTYRYKQPFADGAKPIQYGLIAEEVAEVYPDLVAHSADGQIETVKYQVLDSMLLNELQHEQAEIRAQKDQIQGLQERIDAQQQQNRDLQERLARLEAALSARAH